MAYKNGRLPKSALTSVQGVKLSDPTETAWSKLRAAIRSAEGVDIWPALPDGGYRDFERQADIGAKNPDSSVGIAQPGHSTHGFGTRVDVGSFPPAHDLNRWGSVGRRRRQWLLANAATFGFTREFGEADPNHFKHDGTTAIREAATRKEALAILQHHWKTLSGRNPGAITIARYLPGLMRDRNNTIPLRKKAMTTAAYKRLHKVK